jgi:Immunoglobulin-like domain of bacterial spore germination
MPTSHPLRTLVRSLSPLLLVLALAACERLAGEQFTPIPAPSPIATRPPGATVPATVAASVSPPAGNDNIKVVRPAAKQEVRSPLSVQGQARVFEGNVQVALKDGRGQPLAASFTNATKGAPEWGDYKIDLAFRVTARQDATLDVFTLNARDGTPQFVVSLPLVLLPN